MNTARACWLAIALTGLAGGVHAADARDTALVIIMNPASGIEALHADDAANIFMGRYCKLPSGLNAVPVDIGHSTPLRRRFYGELTGMYFADVLAHWARLVYSGRYPPPLQVADQSTAVRLVSQNEAAIAYVKRDAVTDGVRIVLELPR